MEERRADALAVTLVAVLALGGLAGVSLAGGLGQDPGADASPPTVHGEIAAGTPSGKDAARPDASEPPARESLPDGAGSGAGDGRNAGNGIPNRLLPAAMVTPDGSQAAPTPPVPGNATVPPPTSTPAPPPGPPMLNRPILPGPGTPLPMHTRAAGDGSHVVNAKWAASPRAPQALDVTIYSQALGKNTTARLLLPRAWSTSHSWPTLYMLPGYNDGHRQDSWTAYTDIAKFMADKPAIAVLPSTGRAAFPSNWMVGPQYETYVTQELPAMLRSYGAGSTRAIAGLSVGGYGAMALAARHPGEYQGVASYSGILNTTMPGISQFIQYLLQNIGIDPDDLWGDPVQNSATWRANDPWWQAEGLRGMDIFVSSGTGIPGRHDDSLPTILKRALTDPGALGPNVKGTLLEAGSNLTTHSFALRCATLGIPVTTDYTLTGTHSWGYWQDALRKSWPATLAPALGLS